MSESRVESVIFLSAQPDDYYFQWQLELLLFNLIGLGVVRDQIHILIAYDKKRGLQSHFEYFIEQNRNNACFFCYPDEREYSSYLSSVRPNIIKKHFSDKPELNSCSIFYHDSDIIFRQLPDFESLMESKCWYVSDTRNYIGVDYILATANQQIFEQMCEIIGIPCHVIIDNDNDAGGAQYLMKNVDFNFWDKVERNSEELYALLTDFNCRYADANGSEMSTPRSTYKTISPWYADMWSLLWNGWLFNYEIKISKELDFCWPFDRLEEWNKKKILHYAGNISIKEDLIFRKTTYTLYSPFYDKNIDNLSSSNCSDVLKKIIFQYRSVLEQARMNLLDVSFLIPIRIDSDSRLENLYMVTKFIDKYFNTNLIILESDVESKVDRNALPKSCQYHFEFDDNHFLHRTKSINWLIRKCVSNIIAIYDCDVILPVDQIMKAVQQLRDGHVECIYPFDGTFVNVDILFKKMFEKILDPELLYTNAEKFLTVTKRSFGGAVFLLRNEYLNAGGENEFFESWGPEDLERRKRLSILEYRIDRVKGPIFHLPHERKDNSGYQHYGTKEKYMTEYFRICNMKINQLQQYIASWH